MRRPRLCSSVLLRCYPSRRIRQPRAQRDRQRRGERGREGGRERGRDGKNTGRLDWLRVRCCAVALSGRPPVDERVVRPETSCCWRTHRRLLSSVPVPGPCSYPTNRWARRHTHPRRQSRTHQNPHAGLSLGLLVSIVMRRPLELATPRCLSRPLLLRIQ